MKLNSDESPQERGGGSGKPRRGGFSKGGKSSGSFFARRRTEGGDRFGSEEKAKRPARKFGGKPSSGSKIEGQFRSSRPNTRTKKDPR